MNEPDFDHMKKMDFHLEKIICPECNRIQDAKVEHTFPWFSYIHECECGFIIMESEWIRVEPKNTTK